MTTIRKINVSEVQGYNPNTILPNGTLVLFNDSGVWKLRLHDGITSGGNSVSEIGTISSLTFADNSIQTTAFLGLTDTLDSITGRGAITNNAVTFGEITTSGVIAANTAATGAAAASGHPTSGYGGPLAIFADNDFTQGTLSSVSVGWTVSDNYGWTATVIERGQYGYPGAITLDQNWSGQAPYTYRSADYAPATPANLTLSAANSTWTFGANGALSTPGNIIINTATIGVMPTIVEAGTIINVPLNAAGDTNDYTGGASVIEVPTNPDTLLVAAGWIITFNGGAQRTVSGRTEAGGYTSIYFSEANPGGTLYPLTIQSADYVAPADGRIDLLPDLNNFGAKLSLTNSGNLIFSDSSVQSTAWTGFTANASNWNGAAPVTISEAIDRLAQVVKSLNSGTGA